jgi:peptidoglycan/xylan/chitin deacetylase (PgdA/CDA1 family)
VNRRFYFGEILLLVAGMWGTTGCESPQVGDHASFDQGQVEKYQGGIVRGDKARKAIALAFTGHEFAEGGETILHELQQHGGRASFFFTGTFLTNETFQPLVQRIAAAGHYFSVHSDQHLLYCSWDKDRKTLVTREMFQSDLETNQRRFKALKLPAQAGRCFIPPFEHYNQQIVTWAGEIGFTVINYTPGTHSHADYTSEADKNFASSAAIFDSIVRREQADPNGLNGFILLMHVGSGPTRADKFHRRFGELLDYLASRGYELVRVDELLESKAKP